MRYCSHCGHEVADNAIMCIHCGCSLDGRPAQNAPLDPLSIIGFVVSFFNPVVGLILSLIAHGNVKQQDNKLNKNFAKAGIIISSVELALIVLAVIFWVLIFFLVIVNAPYDPGYNY